MEYYDEYLTFTCWGICLSSLLVVNRNYIFNSLYESIISIKHSSFCFFDKAKLSFILLLALAKFYKPVKKRYINTDKEIAKNIYEISYKLKGSKYRTFVKNNRGPCSVIFAYNEKGEDITKLFLEYYGPNYDFGGFEFTPDFFNSDVIVVEHIDGRELVFKKDDTICIS